MKKNKKLEQNIASKIGTQCSKFNDRCCPLTGRKEGRKEGRVGRRGSKKVKRYRKEVGVVEKEEEEMGVM